jgi:hypothetical protein
MAEAAFPVTPDGSTAARPVARAPEPDERYPDPGQPPFDPREAQFLATEHWSLLATRSLSWNEAFSRTGMFLSTLSAATVALALVGPATQFGPDFAAFALVILSLTLFLGVATFVRLTQVNNEDLYWVAGMNQLRSAYVRLVPGIEREFYAGWSVDGPGISQTFAAIDVLNRSSILHMLVTTPAVVGVISAAVAGVIAGLLAIQVLGGMGEAIGLGIAVCIAGIALSLVFTVREGRRYVSRITAIAAERERDPGGSTPGRA